MDILMIVIFIVLGVSILFSPFIILAIIDERKGKKLKAEKAIKDKDTPIELPKTIHVKVIEKVVDVGMVGIKTPKNVVTHYIIFEDDYGEAHRINVREDMFDCFEEGQKGILTLKSGYIYGFDLDE